MGHFCPAKAGRAGAYELVGYGRPASTPPLKEMWASWYTVTTEADKFLDTLTSVIMQDFLLRDGKPVDESIEMAHAEHLPLLVSHR